MPIEVMAKRGADTMRYGPFAPVGLTDPQNGPPPWANVQLRAEDRPQYVQSGGFPDKPQIRRNWRVYPMIPGWSTPSSSLRRDAPQHVLNSPALLGTDLSLKACSNVFLPGRSRALRGYTESAACGLPSASMEARLSGPRSRRPADTMCGALPRYITTPTKDFQPMGAEHGPSARA